MFLSLLRGFAHIVGFLLLYCICVHTDNVIHAHRGCLTESRPLQELKTVQVQIEAAKKKQKSALTHSLTCRQCITILTHFTVYRCSDGSTSSVTRDTVNKQFNVLVDGFAQTTFTFQLASVEFIVNDVLCRNFTNAPLAAVNRKGGYNVLNIFLGGAFFGSFSVFPDDGALDAIPFDGVFVDVATLPGGPVECCSLGKTAIHEVSETGAHTEAKASLLTISIVYCCDNRWDTGTSPSFFAMALQRAHIRVISSSG